ncbi:MAG TPA: CNP1-like family protein [Ramlibacter sp.]|uniref:CNP1-like family protein n=1 Tax=Ramlibacter sp. TaxID=1917967 RepID=UPI002BE981E6|nr:CNP1-like family protein [Ramlibacter sp.]HVZ43306.1 CNP1-like family protein [Ramlibacter sp.]
MRPESFPAASFAAFAGVLATVFSACVFAQTGTFADPDWKESDVPPPPALRTTGLVPIEVPRTALAFGVDPQSVAIGSDRIVRYVVVAKSSSGAVNGIYEGVNCSAGQVKVFARHNPDRGWVRVEDAQWVPIHDGIHATYSLAIARQGVCIGDAPNRSAQSIVRDLRASDDQRFRTDSFR